MSARGTLPVAVMPTTTAPYNSYTLERFTDRMVLDILAVDKSITVILATQHFGTATFWHSDILPPRHFGTLQKTDILPPRHFATQTFCHTRLFATKTFHHPDILPP